jgi:hypothetical protein
MEAEEYPFIENIDKPLYKYGMIYKYDINKSSMNNMKFKFKRKIKCLAKTSFLAFNVLRFAIYIKLVNNDRLPDYCFDLIQEAGGLVIYFYLANMMVAIMTTGFNYHFNTGNESNMKWIEILKALKGITPLNVVTILDQNEVKKFFVNTKQIYDMIRFSFKINKKCTLIIVCVMFSLKFDDLLRSIKLRLMAALISYFFGYCCLAVFYYSLMYFLIICYYCKICMKTIGRHSQILSNKALIPIV